MINTTPPTIGEGICYLRGMLNVTLKWGWKLRLRLRLVVPKLEKSMRT